MNPTIISVVGRAGAGKTRLIERILPHLSEAGLNVAILKQSRRPLGLTYPATDCARLAQAGAKRSVLLTSEGLLVFPRQQSADLDEALAVAGAGCDLILAEGRPLYDYPMVEVVRAGLPVYPDKDVWLSVSDKPTGRALEVSDELTAAEEILKMLALNRTPAFHS